MSTLKIENLNVCIDNKEILKGSDLTINTGEINALMVMVNQHCYQLSWETLNTK